MKNRKYGMLVEQYLLGPEILWRTVGCMPAWQLDAHPPSGRWTPRQIVMHLADFDLIYADHMKRAIADDRPMLFDVDPDRFAARLAYEVRDVDEDIWLIKAVRQHMAPILRSIDADDFDRVGVHSAFGPMTVGDLLQRVTDHIPHHVAVIEEHRQSMEGATVEPPQMVSAAIR